MLEVVFNESIKGSMKMVKKLAGKNILGEDVVCIGFYLDIGHISGHIDSNHRQRLFKNIWGHGEFEEKEIEEFFYIQKTEINKLLSAAKDGTPIRVWKSQAPFSACGFAFLCYLLRNIDCEIRIISLPEYIVRDSNTIVIYTSWGEVGPDEFKNFLYLEKKLTKMEKSMEANLWEELKLENSPLRANVNGKLVSVPEDFYDHLIIKNIPQGEFSMVRLIGDILGKYDLGIGDTWYAFRIQKMIRENKLEIVSDTKTGHPYEKILRGAKL